jgi:hypothetical protein
MIQPPAFLLQQQVALKTARRVAVVRGVRPLPASSCRDFATWDRNQ